MTARDAKNLPIDSALQTRQIPYSGAANSVVAQKNIERTSTPSSTRDPGRDFEVGRRNINRRSPLGVEHFSKDMAYEILKDLIVSSAHAWYYSVVKSPSPYGEKEKVALNNAESQSAELPSVKSPNVESQTEEKAPAVASLPPEIFRYLGDEGSRPSDFCNNCLANVCGVR